MQRVSLGVCANCSTLACPDHAARDPNVPRWICVLCEAELLSVAGISDIERYQKENLVVISTLAGLVSSAIIEDARRYRSLGHFFEMRPIYRFISDDIADVMRQAEERFNTEFTRTFWSSLDENGKELIAAALAITLRFEIPEDNLIETLRILLAVWRQQG